MSNSCKEGTVYFQGDEALHLMHFATVEGNVCSYTNRARVAFMIINKKETKDLCGNEEDEQIVLENVVDKYSSYLIHAIKKEANPNNQALLFSNLKGSNEIVIKNKLIKLQSSSLYNLKSYGTLLKSKNYRYAYYNKLTKAEKTDSDYKSLSSLDYTRQSCQKVLDKEKSKNSSYISKEENSSYIIISMPYVYNPKKASYDELELTTYEQRVSASYMPEVKVEYGVFFDGTNNNMYNIDFYRNYKKFMKESCSYIIDKRDVGVPQKPNIEDYKTIQEYIAAEPKPKKNQTIMTMLQRQILKNNIRYFDKESNELEEYDDSWFGQVKLSSHAQKVFDYLIDVKDDEEDKLGTNSSQNAFLYEKILPDDGEGSFTNGETNVNRLYRLYNGDDLKTYTDLPPVTRFKVYANGAGTGDVFENEDYEDDSIEGSGLGIGDTGIKANIIYTCNKIAEQLRHSSIFHIDELLLDTFGFSRGAATARHFVCSIANEYELIEGKRKYTLTTKDKKDIFSMFFNKEDGLYARVGNKIYFNPLRVDVEKVTIKTGKKQIIKINPYYKKEKINIESISFRFVGIYDTVPHYGLKQSNDHKDLNLDFLKDDKKFGHIVHFMAEDEYRYNFDAYSIFKDKYNNHYNMNSNQNLEEFIIPGAHSDVGGGYNEENELIYLGAISSSLNKIKNKIRSWNMRFNWLKNSDPTLIKNRVRLQKKDLENYDDGFYITKQLSSSGMNSYYRVYMYKSNIFNKYEYVGLKLMYDKAINDKDNLEKVPLASPNKNYSLNGLLTTIYNKLSNLQKLNDVDKENYIILKDDYIHHSSKVSDLVSKPSMENRKKADFYGQRVVYGSTGISFTNSDG